MIRYYAGSVCVRERTFEDKSGLVPTDSVRRKEGLKRGIDRRAQVRWHYLLQNSWQSWTKALVLGFKP
jgi:hypothetical protein